MDPSVLSANVMATTSQPPSSSPAIGQSDKRFPKVRGGQRGTRVHVPSPCGRGGSNLGLSQPTKPYTMDPIPISQETVDISDNVAELKSASIDVVGEHDLLIVGPGVLGRIVARQWQQEYPDCQIYGQTMTTDHHDELMKVGIKPFLRGTKFSHKFPYVIFCAPPSPAVDYPNDLRLSASNWSGEGSFLFTSSTAVYDCSDNGLCNEDHPPVPIGRSPRTDVLLKAENAVLEAGGCVLRLVGLYESDKGPHVYWLEKGTVESRPDHILNLIHYEDAASLSVAILKKKLQNRVFVGCDNHPVSRQDIMDAVSQSGKFSKKFNGFTGTDDPLGKKIYNPKTRSEIGWEPKYPSFRQFLGLTD